ncbi:phosphoglycerate mutase-like protein [Russula compacta]|nr:phosphoglycerate mutase-like protein [Russula compacta]
MSNSVIFTFVSFIHSHATIAGPFLSQIRHGESTDNLKYVWAGWKDAPLSNHGMNQARALGEFFADTHFTAIHSSDLKRAFTTAQALYDAQRDPKPTFDSSELLREQNFGVAEGKPWSYNWNLNINLEEEMAKGVFPTLHGNDEKYPEGESINDLAQRAKSAITAFVLPHVWRAAKEGQTGVHVAVVSHGLCISQMISELLKMNAKQDKEGNYRGLENTAWTRVVIHVEGGQESQPTAVDKEHPLLVMHVTDINKHSHIDNIKRQKGGIGSAAYDPKQKDIKAFFGGKAEISPDNNNSTDDEVTHGEDIIE